MILRYLISGRVQGVAFRWFVRQEAGLLGIRGSVRNLPDGRVEVIAAGEQPAMDRLAGLLRQGPPGARVREVAVSELPADHQVPPDFRIAR